MQAQSILVTGATGYVGGRLVPRLLAQGHRVRAMGRSLEKLRGRYWSSHPNVELIAANVEDYDALCEAMRGCKVAYYLVHSMLQQKRHFEKADREAALNFAAAAASTGIERIIYLGGLGHREERLSPHLQSRKEVGDIFAKCTIPTTQLRAAMIIGAGSASFEILRYLVDRLPLMITPRWVRTQVQPIAIANVLDYLIGVLDVEETKGKIFDIGGPEVVTYQQLMKLYAHAVGLRKRLIIPVPVLTPKLSSYWIGLVTPLPPSIGKPLAQGLSNRVVCEESRIQTLIPLKLLSCKQAIERAVNTLQHDQIETSWSDAGTIPPAEWADREEPTWAGGTIFKEHYTAEIATSAQHVWNVILQIGGETGWYSSAWLWKLRGAIDKAVGGVGLRRGRRKKEELLPGDSLDFWRVRLVEKPYHLMLVAEMKVPGEAILEFRLHETAQNTTELHQVARFRPSGLFGILYWYVVSPFHHWIFSSMLKEIEKRAVLASGRKQ